MPTAARKHQAQVTCEFSGVKNIFSCVSETAVCSLAGPYTHPEISTLQRCTWHTLVRHTKAVLSGTQHGAVMSCKCRILSNITIATEGPWRAPGPELGSAQIHWNALRKFQSLTSKTCTYNTVPAPPLFPNSSSSSLTSLGLWRCCQSSISPFLQSQE